MMVREKNLYESKNESKNDLKTKNIDFVELKVSSLEHIQV